MPLYPEEAEGDRMIHQLNFIPPHVPHNQDSADIPLKKILFWTGAGGRVVGSMILPGYQNSDLAT